MSLYARLKKDFGSFLLDAELSSEGGILGILGASGSGKSMTLKMLSGIETPDEGQIILDGRTLFDSEKHINLPPQKRRVGYLFQNYALFRRMTVEKNIASGLIAGHGTAPGEIRDTVERMVKLFRLEGLEGHFPGQLSGGQQQRVAFARMLACRPEAILLDEPFSALDSWLREQLQFEMKEILDAYPGDVLMVSHSRDEIYRFCENSVILADGRVVRAGATKDIFRNPGNRTAARLTGCKNISPARRMGEGKIFAEDWNLELRTAAPLERNTGCIGIRAHEIVPETAPEFSASGNIFRAEVLEIMKEPFEWHIFLRPEGAKDNLYWKLEYKQAALAESFRKGDIIRCGIWPEDILMLREE